MMKKLLAFVLLTAVLACSSTMGARYRAEMYGQADPACVVERWR